MMVLLSALMDVVDMSRLDANAAVYTECGVFELCRGADSIHMARGTP